MVVSHVSLIVIRENLDSTVVFAQLDIHLAAEIAVPRVLSLIAIPRPEVSPVPETSNGSSWPSDDGPVHGRAGVVLVVVLLVYNDHGGAGR